MYPPRVFCKESAEQEGFGGHVCLFVFRLDKMTANICKNCVGDVFIYLFMYSFVLFLFAIVEFLLLLFLQPVGH